MHIPGYNIKRSILLYVLIFLMVILLTTVLTYLGTTDQLYEQLTHTNIALLEQISQNIDTKLRAIDREIISFTQDDEVASFMDRRIVADYEKYKNLMNLQLRMKNIIMANSEVISFYLYSALTNRVLTDVSLDNTNDFFDQEWFDGFNNMSGYYSWLSTRKVKGLAYENHRDVISLIRRYPAVVSSAYQRGAVVVNIDENILYNSIKSVKSNQLEHYFIVDIHGHVVSHDDKSKLYTSVNEYAYMASIMGQEQGRLDWEIDGARTSIFFTTSPYTGWKYISMMPYLKASQPLIALRNILFYIAIGMFLSGVILIIVVSRWTFRPIDAFIKSVSKKVWEFESSGSANTGMPTQDLNSLEHLFSSMLEDHKKMQKQIKSSMPAIKWRMVMDIILGNRKDYMEIHEHLKLLGINLHAQNYIVIISELDSMTKLKKSVPAQGLTLYTSAICKHAEDIINEDNMGTAIELSEGKVAIILSFDNDDNDNNQLVVYTIGDQLKTFVQDYFGVTVTLGVGSFYTDMKDIYKSYHEAVEALKYKAVMGRNTLISIDDIRIHDERNIYKVLSHINNIVQSIKCTDKGKVKQQLEAMFEQIIENNFPVGIIRQVGLQLLIQGVKTTLDTGIHIDDVLNLDAYDGYELLNELETVDQIREHIEGLFFLFINKILEKRDDSGHDEFIENILAYIKENFTKNDISLNQIANKFSISVPYLSKIFKDVTETKFLDYLIMLRVQRAKELLSTTDLKVQAIALEIGYSNSHSFIRIFKQYTGNTPGEYRTLANYKGIQEA